MIAWSPLMNVWFARHSTWTSDAPISGTSSTCPVIGGDSVRYLQKVARSRQR